MQDTNIDNNKAFGFIKLYRSFKDWQWYTEPNTAHLFLHLILSANWETKKWKGRIVKRGQFITSLPGLVLNTGLTLSEIRTSLERLIKSGEICKESTNHNTLITIIKYDSYQDIGDDVSRQIANKSQTNRNPIATTKEVKENKEVKESVCSSHADFVNLKFKKEVDDLKRLMPMSKSEYNKYLDYFNEQCLKKKYSVDQTSFGMFKRVYGNWYKRLDKGQNNSNNKPLPSMD
tara:strand:+ start:4384 stop:5079 length:696 start_codon:yes stop_codon:yes gene_type:complete